MQTNEPVVNLNLDLIIPNSYQPRKSFNDNTLNELALSIREYGVINPILVRQQGEKYEIIAGERRVRAAKKAGLTTIPAIIKQIEDNKMAELALIENLQRENITPIEEAESYQQILKISNMTEEKLSEMIGKSQSSISNKLRLLTLPENIKDAILQRKISERHARSLLTVKDINEQNTLLERIITEKLTVKELDNIIKEKSDELNDSSFDKKEEKESENMNNESFFPNFNNSNIGQNNNMSLNNINMPPVGTQVAPQVNIMPMNPSPVVEQASNVGIANVAQQPTPMPGPSFNSDTSDMINPTTTSNEQTMSPIPDFGMNNNVQSQPEPLLNIGPMSVNETATVSSPNSVSTPTVDPLNSIPLFNNQQSTPPTAPETQSVTSEPVIPNTMEQIPTSEPISPMIDPPLFSSGITEPLEQGTSESPSVMPEITNNESQFDIPVTTSTGGEVDKFTQVQELLNNNGIEFKAYSNETGHCIIIEL